MKIFTTAAGDYVSALFIDGYCVVVSSGVEESSKVINEDGSGDGLLFENDDQWVTE